MSSFCAILCIIFFECSINNFLMVYFTLLRCILHAKILINDNLSVGSICHVRGD